MTKITSIIQYMINTSNSDVHIEKYIYVNQGLKSSIMPEGFDLYLDDMVSEPYCVVAVWF